MVALGFALGLLGVALAAESSVAEGSAVLAIALATVGGTKIGHSSRGGHDELDEFDLVLVVIAALAAGSAACMLDDEHLTASLSLMVAAAGVAAAHLLHHGLAGWEPAGMPFLLRADEFLGWACILGAGLAGLAGNLWIPDRAEAVATVAAAGITVGGTLLSHARSRSSAITSHERSHPPDGSPAATLPDTDTARPAPR